MDYLKTIAGIISQLKEFGYVDKAQEIESLENAASTGSELLLSVTHTLLASINSDVICRELIGEEVIELREYCWSNGLHVK